MATDAFVNVKDFGAEGDGTPHPLSDLYGSVEESNIRYPGATSLDDEVDWAAIQTAIDEAAESGLLMVYIPPGRYLINRKIEIKVDNLEIIGSPGAVIVENVATPSEAFIPILAQKDSIEPIKNLTIKDITVEFLQAGPESAGGIQLNQCVDFCVENVRIIGNGEGMNGSITNGISCAYPQSTGVFRNVVVSGVSKPGLYVALGHDIRIEGCVARKCLATYPLPPKNPWLVPGFSIGNANNVIIANCQAYDNSGAGVQISRLGFHFDFNFGSEERRDIEADILDSGGISSTLLSELRDRGINVDEELGADPIVTGSRWRIYDANTHETYLLVRRYGCPKTETTCLPRAQEGYISFTSSAYSNVQVIGGHFHNNGTHGILTGTHLIGSQGNGLQIIGANCSANASAGISMTAAHNVLVEGCIAAHNQSGISISDIGPGQKAFLFQPFSVGLEFVDDMKTGTFTESLRRVLRDHGITLPVHPSVTTEVVESQWRIDDQDGVYTVIKAGDVLNIDREWEKDQISLINVRGCQVYDNKVTGMLLRATNDVTVENCRIYHSIEGVQSRGITFQLAKLFSVETAYESDLDQHGGKVPDGLRQEFLDRGFPLSSTVTCKRDYETKIEQWFIEDISRNWTYRLAKGFEVIEEVQTERILVFLQKKNANVRIVDVDFSPMNTIGVPIDYQYDIASAVEKGHYRLQSYTIGDPNKKVYAPCGSEYTDLQTGIKYLKRAGFSNIVWEAI